MKLTADHIQFDSLKGLKSFLIHNNLYGIIKLSEQIMDNTGKILLKENIAIKESLIEKLETLSGQYPEKFTVSLTKEILKKFRETITAKILKRLETSENEFLKQLYVKNQHNYKAYILHSLQNRKLLMLVFKISSEKETFFNHIADMGLLSLGIIIQKCYRVKMIHRYSFLAGLCADLYSADKNIWKTQAASDSERSARAKEGAGFLGEFDLPGEISDSIAKHAYSDSAANVNATELLLPEATEEETSSGSIFEGILGSSDNEEDDETAKEEPYNEMLALTVVEAMRIARYIDDITRRNEDKDYQAEEMIYFLAYNSEKGYFHKDLVNPLIVRFKEYEKLIHKARKMAEIENMCLYPPSAWVYPKPNASQVVCKNRVLDCPKLVSGWDLHVISQQEAYGWIGASMDPGNYPKCGFESHLEELIKELEKEEFKSGKKPGSKQ